jgi:hypothetical protein
VIDVIGVDNLILNTCLGSMGKAPELMTMRQVRVMCGGNRVIPIIRICSHTLMFRGCLKVMCRGAMVLGGGMMDEVFSLSIHQIPHLKSGK